MFPFKQHRAPWRLPNRKPVVLLHPLSPECASVDETPPLFADPHASLDIIQGEPEEDVERHIEWNPQGLHIRVLVSLLGVVDCAEETDLVWVLLIATVLVPIATLLVPVTMVLIIRRVAAMAGVFSPGSRQN